MEKNQGITHVEALGTISLTTNVTNILITIWQLALHLEVIRVRMCERQSECGSASGVVGRDTE